MKSLSDYKASLKKRGNTAKGNAFEEEIATDLRLAGWVVDVTKLNRTIRRGRWVTVKGDFFEEFDILALKVAESALFIQATTDRGGAALKRAKIDKKFPLGPSVGREYLVVTRPPNGVGFEIHRRIVSGWVPPILTTTIDIGWGIS